MAPWHRVCKVKHWGSCLPLLCLSASYQSPNYRDLAYVVSIHLFFSPRSLSQSKSPSSSFCITLIHSQIVPSIYFCSSSMYYSHYWPSDLLKKHWSDHVTSMLKTLNDFPLLLGQVPKDISNGLQRPAFLSSSSLSFFSWIHFYTSIMKLSFVSQTMFFSTSGPLCTCFCCISVYIKAEIKEPPV